MPIDGRFSRDEEEPAKERQNPPSIAAATVHTLPYKRQKVKYMHHTFFAMSPATLEKAIISNNQLKEFPMMNLKDIRRHLPPSPATPKGRMERPRGGIRSTRQKRKDEFEKELEEQLLLDKDMHPTTGSTALEGVILSSNVICSAALADKEKGTVYTDVTGALPVLSLDGHQYYIVAYDYDDNFIETQEVSDRTEETIVETLCKRYLIKWKRTSANQC